MQNQAPMTSSGTSASGVAQASTPLPGIYQAPPGIPVQAPPLVPQQTYSGAGKRMDAILKVVLYMYMYRVNVY